MAVEVHRAAAYRRGDAASWYEYGASLAMAGDAAGAVLVFRYVAELDPEFPQIGERIAAAEARAARNLDLRIERPGFGVEPEATAAARRAALERGDLVFAQRANAYLSGHLAAPVDAAAESGTAALEGAADRAAAFAVAAAGLAPDDPDAALHAADMLRSAGDLEAARYFLERYVELGGDLRTAAPVRRAIDRAETSGSTR
jgi:hypothetical protein